MTAKPLTAGTIRGRKCPYCPVVAQRLDVTQGPDPDGRKGLAAHVRVVHPDMYALYEQWRRST